MRRRLIEGLALGLAAAIWWPSMHLIWRPSVAAGGGELDPIAVPMAVGLEEIWGGVTADAEGIGSMREVNPEWDFMGRTFFVLGEANLALRVPERKAHCLEVIDALNADTLAMEARHGMEHFLMSYHADRPWVERPPRSVFVDGEIALCLGARLLVEEDEELKEAFRARITVIRERLERGPVLCAESYPDECWIFCNTAAMAAMRMAEVIEGDDFSGLKQRWLQVLKEQLVDTETGMLISTFTYAGVPHPAGPGPEGSSIWFAAHMLQVIDPEFATQQYRLARKHLGRSLFGFGYSKEWPSLSLRGMDVDSGIVVPGLGASASASGLALVAAAGFQDRPFYRQLRTSLELGAFPERDGGSASFLMAGAIGDPVIFYSTVVGPLWEKLAP